MSGRVSLQVINNIASKIEGLFCYWCDGMKLPQTSSNSCSQPPWYDEECYAVKKKNLSSSIYLQKLEKDIFWKCLGHSETNLSI